MARKESKKIVKMHDKPAKLRADETPLLVFTNDKQGAARKGEMLKMLYRAVSIGQLAYVDGLDPDTGETIPLLCGIEPTGVGNQVRVYPLAKIFNKQSEVIKQYGVPDGQGGYFGEQSGEPEEKARTPAQDTAGSPEADALVG